MNSSTRWKYAADHFAVDEGDTRGVQHLELDTPRLVRQADLEVAEPLEQFARIVVHAACIEHGKRAAAEEGVKTAVTAVEQLGDFLVGEVLEAALRRHLRGNELLGVQHGPVVDGGVRIGRGVNVVQVGIFAHHDAIIAAEILILPLKI